MAQLPGTGPVHLPEHPAFWIIARCSYQTLNLLRPLALLLFITALPALVFMRRRKPWVLFRLMLLGWNVLFITFSLNLSNFPRIPIWNPCGHQRKGELRCSIYAILSRGGRVIAEKPINRRYNHRKIWVSNKNLLWYNGEFCHGSAEKPQLLLWGQGAAGQDNKLFYVYITSMRTA